MNAAEARILILLLFVCGGTLAWELARNNQLEPVQGQVVGHVYRGYVIAYSIQQQRYETEARVGLFDALGGLRQTQLGDEIPMLVDPKKPYVALVNTANGRHGLTISAFMLLPLLSIAINAAMRRKERDG
ncbi:MAG TPA: hypothetical protein VK099_01885 [Alcanivoracaceae bacterium]|nr:hypothetical protein [Alcanivoracaceae bacterium]